MVERKNLDYVDIIGEMMEKFSLAEPRIEAEQNQKDFIMRRHNRFLRTYFVSTDYCCPPYCGQSDLDCYFIPDQGLADKFVRCGIKAERLAVTGIPFPKAFYASLDKREAKRQLGISLYTPHLLILGVGMGRETTRALIRRIAKRIQPNSCVSVICGGDQYLFHQLEREYAEHHGILVRSDAAKLAELMDSADLLLTRPNGGILSVAVQKRLPLLCFKQEFGCECQNLRYLTTKGVALTADTQKALAGLACTLLSDGSLLENMTENYRHILVDHHATESIVEYVARPPAEQKR